ncbi:MAG TPA: hypothetical protein VEH06_08080 [Candidatus Bathyarchaeia archaeon]|nr:hypothetical protein [Candidatus Bathyarchaeia archaeon]
MDSAIGQLIIPATTECGNSNTATKCGNSNSMYSRYVTEFIFEETPSSLESVAFRVSEGSIPICSSTSQKPVIMYRRDNVDNSFVWFVESIK